MKSKINFDTTKKLIILSTTLSIIIAAIIFFVLYPYFTKIQTLNINVNDQRIQLAIYEDQRINIDKTRSDLKKIENDINDISLIFVEQENILDFIDTLDFISENNNLVQTINIINLDNIETDNYLQISVGIDGEWDNIINYLNTLEKLDYYVILDNLNFSKLSEKINLTFTAIVYSS